MRNKWERESYSDYEGKNALFADDMIVYVENPKEYIF